MLMSIPREHGSASGIPVDREALADATAHVIHISHLLYGSDPVPELVGGSLLEIFLALPDEEIAELDYTLMEMGIADFAIMLAKKVQTVQTLREQIDNCIGTLEEN